MDHKQELTDFEAEILMYINKHSPVSTKAIKENFSSHRFPDFDEVDEAIFDIGAKQMICVFGKPSDQVWMITSAGVCAIRSEEIQRRRKFKFQIISFLLGLLSGVIATLVGSTIHTVIISSLF